jgi:hypothetical protein
MPIRFTINMNVSDDIYDIVGFIFIIQEDIWERQQMQKKLKHYRH